ncbi:MAG TPA: hypothetical protein VN700_01725 [Vicinamibacterales bacterium]|nr:hypothetical protein [Vicinamibacterales bacterium]
MVAGSIPVTHPKSISHLSFVIGTSVLWTLLLIAAAAVRWPGLGTDLWLDELWARRMAIAMPSAFTTFTLHHEVNHYLTTIWFYMTGPDASALIYRLPSFAAGVASVAVAGLIGRRRSAATAVFAMVLTASSYELIVFSSEARGYSIAVLCTLLSFLLLDLHFERPRRWTFGAYAFIASIGLLTQPVFATVLAAASAWSAVEWWCAKPRSAASAWRTGAPQLLPLTALAALYFGDLRHVVSGGGTGITSFFDAYVTGLAWSLGAPDPATFRVAVAIVAAVVILAGAHVASVASKGAAVFFIGAIVIFPNVAIVLRGSEMVYTRHFLLGSVLTLVLLAYLLGWMWDMGRASRFSAGAAVLLFITANGLHLQTFLERGRGKYQEAILFMADRTAGPVTIAADHDFRVGLELDYYLKRVLGSRPAAFIPEGAWPRGGPAWIVANADHYEAPALPHSVYEDAAGNQYELVRTVPTSPLTGLHWFLFRNRAPH